MSPSLNDVLDRALALTYAERLMLVSELTASVREEDPRWPPVWRQRLRERMLALRTGMVAEEAAPPTAE